MIKRIGFCCWILFSVIPLFTFTYQTNKTQKIYETIQIYQSNTWKITENFYNTFLVFCINPVVFMWLKKCTIILNFLQQLWLCNIKIPSFILNKKHNNNKLMNVFMNDSIIWTHRKAKETHNEIKIYKYKFNHIK